jgi:hypothetical protein
VRTHEVTPSDYQMFEASVRKNIYWWTQPNHVN